MLSFILNDREVQTEASPAMVLADFVRVERGLVGTKLACREGDCGACTALVGELNGANLSYRAVTSCIYPLGNVAGKHVVTIEGLNQMEITPIQQAIVASGGTQCGFCTPGFVVALTALFLKKREFDPTSACAELDGNICRCTGYKSIERAVEKLSEQFGSNSNLDQDRIDELVKWNILPSQFLGISARLGALNQVQKKISNISERKIVGGGTDLYVQIPEQMLEKEIFLSRERQKLKGIKFKGGKCTIGAATTLEELRESVELNTAIPRLSEYLKLFGSTPIRQMATIGGNLVNASPIGDSTALFLALDSEIIVGDNERTRELELKDFYLGYKKLDLKKGEMVLALRFSIPTATSKINFEKVSRRTYLDIASVNSGIHLKLQSGRITAGTISAGGVAPIPMVLSEASKFLCGKEVGITTIKKVVEIAQVEISPISDVRGTSEYKRLLLRQLIYAHFINCFPEKVSLGQLI